MKKRLLTILLLGITLFIFSSCVIEINTDLTEWTFDNLSDYDIVVEIENGFPSILNISAGDSETTTIYDGEDPDYDYSKKLFVSDDVIRSKKTIEFYEAW